MTNWKSSDLSIGDMKKLLLLPLLFGLALPAFADPVLVVDEKENLRVWDTGDFNLGLEADFLEVDFKLTVLAHPEYFLGISNLQLINSGIETQACLAVTADRLDTHGLLLIPTKALEPDRTFEPVRSLRPVATLNYLKRYDLRSNHVYRRSRDAL